MKKLLLLCMILVIASQAIFGQTKYCQNENIYLFNLPGAMWNVSALPPLPTTGQIIYMNTYNYTISHNGVSVPVNSQNFTPDNYFSNITFNANGEASFCITCVQMLGWQWNPGWNQLNGTYTSGPVCITIKQKPNILNATSTAPGACSNVGSTIGVNSSQSGVT